MISGLDIKAAISPALTRSQRHWPGRDAHAGRVAPGAYAQARTAVSQLADLLLWLAECSGAIETGHLDLAMNRQDIADHLGLSVEAVSHALHSLAAARNIAIEGPHRVVLCNIEMLCELAE